MPPSTICRRRPLLAAAPTPSAPPDPVTLRNRLESLLHSLPRYADRAANQVEETADEVPDQARRLFSKNGPFGALQFWRNNRDKIEKSQKQLLDVGESIIQRDAEAVRRKASALDLRWLLPRAVDRDVAISDEPLSSVVDDNTPDLNIPSQLKNAALFAVDALTPWDFDRHDFGLTFATTWMDSGTVPLATFGGKEFTPVVKMTSTIKPLEQEWKLTARAKLLELVPGAVVFGKAGMYLAGEQPAYIGVEADRVWKVPRWKGGKLFGNVNYRSSRKPATDPVKVTAGVQQDFEIGRFVLTLRVGIDPVDRRKIFVAPVPHGEYF